MARNPLSARQAFLLLGTACALLLYLFKASPVSIAPAFLVVGSLGAWLAATDRPGLKQRLKTSWIGKHTLTLAAALLLFGTTGVIGGLLMPSGGVFLFSAIALWSGILLLGVMSLALDDRSKLM